MHNHLKTWTAWLESIAPANDPAMRPAMAEALALAAPQGPQGFMCVDDCRCDSSIPSFASELCEALLDAHYDVPLDKVRSGEFIKKISAALQLDRRLEMRLPQHRELHARMLAEHGVVVSFRNAQVAHVRELYPNTWNVIQEMRP